MWLSLAVPQAALSASPGNQQRDIGQEERNRDLVVRFYDRFFNAHDMAAADDMLSEDYVQHNPNIATGRAAFVDFATRRFAESPQSHSTIIRSAVDHDLVYLHIHSLDRRGDKGRAIINIFRVKDGKIVEHWDVVQPVPENSANQNSMF
jgi:predicted SnoaL-like aldol condensation-catalyzing enzyme